MRPRLGRRRHELLRASIATAAATPVGEAASAAVARQRGRQGGGNEANAADVHEGAALEGWLARRRFWPRRQARGGGGGGRCGGRTGVRRRSRSRAPGGAASAGRSWGRGGGGERPPLTFRPVCAHVAPRKRRLWHGAARTRDGTAGRCPCLVAGGRRWLLGGVGTAGRGGWLQRGLLAALSRPCFGHQAARVPRLTMPPRHSRHPPSRGTTSTARWLAPTPPAIPWERSARRRVGQTCGLQGGCRWN
ncbi:hypothetical protein I4F81_012575 [Pyropia yezoensis]|uniref:Uncharacterized protein n=1 Tax=Pyropia yezoensis TaxID=2788 RepID=A0ACC3CJ22_PYRYE|nr:hypothetical protein I4F81_012575 [Neopyropia yezoensis]